MIRVILESPFAANEKHTVEEHIKYARACVRDCVLRGESPCCSHLLFTQEGILDDSVPEERQLGIDAGLVWGAAAEKTVAYTDFGISRGMQYGIDNATNAGRVVEYRKLWDY